MQGNVGRLLRDGRRTPRPRPGKPPVRARMQSSFQPWSLDAGPDPAKSSAPPAARRRLAVLLSGPKPPSWDTADRWLIQLRWGAIAGMIATTVAGRKLVLDLRRSADRRHRRDRVRPTSPGPSGSSARRPDGASPRRASPRRTARAQLVGDVIANAWMLWLLGGLANPFAVFLAFHIALSGLLCPRRTTVLVGLLTLAAIAVLTYATPLLLDAAPLGGERIRRLGDLRVVHVADAVPRLLRRRLRARRSRSSGSRVSGTSGWRCSAGWGGGDVARARHAARDDPAREQGPRRRGARRGSGGAARMAETVAGEVRRASDHRLMRGQIRLDQRLDRRAHPLRARPRRRSSCAARLPRGELRASTRRRPQQADVLRPASLGGASSTCSPTPSEAMADSAEQRIERQRRSSAEATPARSRSPTTGAQPRHRRAARGAVPDDEDGAGRHGARALHQLDDGLPHERGAAHGECREPAARRRPCASASTGARTPWTRIPGALKRSGAPEVKMTRRIETAPSRTTTAFRTTWVGEQRRRGSWPGPR